MAQSEGRKIQLFVFNLKIVVLRWSAISMNPVIAGSFLNSSGILKQTPPQPGILPEGFKDGAIIGGLTATVCSGLRASVDCLIILRVH